MGLLWKKGKKKGSRISRIVVDLQSPNRGNSLVVETGFPTSLIDLFVKNKDRLKKPPTLNPNKCKKKKKKVVEEEKFIKEEDVLVVSNPVPETGFREEEVEGELGGVEVVSEENKRVLVFGVFWRVFVVVLLLGSSVKEMVFGVTVSAFVLIFMEFLGRRLGYCLNVAVGGLRVLIGRLLCLFRIGKEGGDDGFDQFPRLGLGVVEECNLGDGDSQGLVGGVGLDTRVEEIQVVEFVAQMDGEEVEGKGVPLELNKCGGVGIVEVDSDSNGSEERGREQGRSARIKAKVMKMLVPKKFRGGKKGKECKEKESDSGDCVSTCLGDPDMGKIEAFKEQRDCDKKGLEEGKLFLSRLVKDSEGGREVNVDCGDWNNSMNPGKGNVDYVILFLVVLTGLVGGRVLAFLLALGSCLMLKFAQRLRRYTDKSLSR